MQGTARGGENGMRQGLDIYGPWDVGHTPPGGIVAEAETDMAEESALQTHEGRGWS